MDGWLTITFDPPLVVQGEVEQTICLDCKVVVLAAEEDDHFATAEHRMKSTGLKGMRSCPTHEIQLAEVTVPPHQYPLTGD